MVRSLLGKGRRSHRVAVGGAKERGDNRRVRVDGLISRDRARVGWTGSVRGVAVGSGVLEAGHNDVVDGGLFKVGEQERLGGDAIRARANTCVTGDSRDKGIGVLVRDAVVSVVEVLNRKSHLFEVVRALHASRRFTSRLDGGEDDGLLFIAQQAAVPAMGIEAEDGDLRRVEDDHVHV